VANGVWVEMMELKPIVVKKAAEERTRGEGQTPFGKMVECDMISRNGERFVE
jgi:hypothetical protein